MAKGRRPFKSLYHPQHPEKYKGRLDRIVARSNLERAIFKFLDINKNVLEWSSEEVIVPYICGTDGENHRYFVDIFVHLANNEKLLVEIKPASQSRPPLPPKKDTPKAMRAYQGALYTWTKNSSKWHAATKYAEQRGWRFVVWTEEHLAAMGIRFV